MRIVRSLAVLGIVGSVTLLTACGSGSDKSAVEGIETPDGVELTPPGTTLAFGETANVVVQDLEDTPRTFWAIKGEELYDVSVEEAVTNAGGDVVDDQDSVDHFICAPYTLTYLGTEDTSGFEYPDSADLPHMSLLGDDNRMANSIIGVGGSDACGIHDSENASSRVEDLEVGREYRGAQISFIEKDAGDDGVEATRLKFAYDVATVPELQDGTEIKQIVWK